MTDEKPDVERYMKWAREKVQAAIDEFLREESWGPRRCLVTALFSMLAVLTQAYHELATLSAKEHEETISLAEMYVTLSDFQRQVLERLGNGKEATPSKV